MDNLDERCNTSCFLLRTVGCDMCQDSNHCALEEIRNAGYEIHQKNQVEQIEEGSPVAAHLRLGDQPGGVQSNGDQGSLRSDKEGNLTQKEIAKLRKHMALWPE